MSHSFLYFYDLNLKHIDFIMTSLSELKKAIHGHIRAGNIKASLDILINYLEVSGRRKEHNQALQLQSIFASAHEEKLLGTISLDNYNLIKNQTVKGVLSIVDSLEQRLQQSSLQKIRKNNRIWLWVILSVVVLGLAVTGKAIWKWTDSDEPSQPPIADPTVIDSSKFVESKRQKEYKNHGTLFSDIGEAENLIYFKQWAPAYRKYFSIYNSMPDYLKSKLNQNDIKKAVKKYESGNWDEAAKLMKTNFDDFKNTVHNQN